MGGAQSKVRVVMIVDEADLCLGNPARKSNASARLHFHDKVRAFA